MAIAFADLTAADAWTRVGVDGTLADRRAKKVHGNACHHDTGPSRDARAGQA